MLLDSLTLAVLAASATNAFLIPPEVSAIDAGIAEAIAASHAVETADTAERRVVKFDCPGCPVVFDGHHGPKTQTDKANHLELTFSVEHHSDAADTLTLNGVSLFPVNEGVLFGNQVLDWKPWGGKHGHHGGPPPWARGGPPNIPPPWMRGHGEHHKGPGGPPPWAFGGHGGPPKLLPQPLGFVMMGGDVKDAETDMELISLSFRVLQVGDRAIDGLPEINIQLIKDGDRLMIAKIDKVEVAPPMAKHKECSSTLCKVMTAIFGPKSGKPCHSSAAVAAPAGEVTEVGEKPPLKADDAVMRQNEHTWGQLFKSVASHILLPVLIGIVAGVSASFIGMVVGTLIVSLWRTFFRRPGDRRHRRQHSRSHSQSHKAAPKEALVEEEKSGLMEHQDPPPSYETEEGTKKANTEV